MAVVCMTLVPLRSKLAPMCISVEPVRCCCGASAQLLRSQSLSFYSVTVQVDAVLYWLRSAVGW